MAPHETFGNIWRHWWSQFGCEWGLLLASRRKRQGIVLNILQCTGRPHIHILELPSPKPQQAREESHERVAWACPALLFLWVHLSLSLHVSLVAVLEWDPSTQSSTHWSQRICAPPYPSTPLGIRAPFLSDPASHLSGVFQVRRGSMIFSTSGHTL